MLKEKREVDEFSLLCLIKLDCFKKILLICYFVCFFTPQPPAVITVVLKVGMHCEACAQVLQKRIRKIRGKSNKQLLHCHLTLSVLFRQGTSLHHTLGQGRWWALGMGGSSFKKGGKLRGHI